jgi:hypothetical protein
MMTTTSSSRAKKGRNFSTDKERQVCLSVLHISQDLRIGNGQRKDAFWQRIEAQLSFTFLHCWYILREHPYWMETLEEQRSRQQLRRAPGRSAAPRTPTHISEQEDFGEDRPQVDSDPTAVLTSGTCRSSGSGVAKRKRPMGGKCAKEEVKAQKQRECAVRAQAQATADMAAANVQKAQVLQDQAALNLFTMPGADPVEVAEYLRLRRQEELVKLKCRLDDVTKKARIEAAEKARVDADNAAEVAETMRQRVPPPPLSRSPSPHPIDSGSEDAEDAPSPPPQTRPTPFPDSQFRLQSKIEARRRIQSASNNR